MGRTLDGVSLGSAFAISSRCWCAALVFFMRHFSMSPRAAMQTLSLSRKPDAVCLAFRTSLTGTMSSKVAMNLTEVNDVPASVRMKRTDCVRP